jgi:hypothetical protein
VWRRRDPEIVGAWRNGSRRGLKILCPQGRAGSNPAAPTTHGSPSLAPEQRPSYSYLLGIYLGDGHITREPRTYRLHVYMNARDTRVISQTAEAMRRLLPHNRVGFRCRPSVVVVNSYSQQWPRLFPQHGAGRKHLRPIVLEPWQREIVERFSEEFIRGCLDSDGCRHRRIVRGRNYPAYSFRNSSEDILRLFSDACDMAGVRWRRANKETVSIARRGDVARLDAIFAAAAPQIFSVIPSSLANTSTPGA